MKKYKFKIADREWRIRWEHSNVLKFKPESYYSKWRAAVPIYAIRSLAYNNNNEVKFIRGEINDFTFERIFSCDLLTIQLFIHFVEFTCSMKQKG